MIREGSGGDSSQDLLGCRMLNMMWPGNGELHIKEEQQDVCSERGSPRLMEPMPVSSYADLSYDVTVTLTPTHGYEYLEPAESPHLQTLQPLPSFHSLPSSPSRKQLEGIPVSLTEFLHSSQSPDSSGQPAPLSTQAPHTVAQRRRKRANSGSSCGSGTSSTTKQMKRKRPPISQEELMEQRNQANVRERERTKNLNDAFSSLREIVPTLPSDKLSKIKTLQLASKYIDFLKQVLKEGDQQVFDARSSSYSGISLREELSHSFNVWRMDMNYKGPGALTSDQ